MPHGRTVNMTVLDKAGALSIVCVNRRVGLLTAISL
jgi:hypothetical protein